MNKNKCNMGKLLLLIAIFGATVTTHVSHASLVITGTRVVFTPGATEKTVAIRNEGQAPVLMQTWLDNGNSDATPDNLKTPFLLLPPLSRVDPGKGQVVRVIPTDNNFAQDRESIYWLNVLEVRPKPENTPDNYLLFNYRTRIKLFYRPIALKGITLEKSAETLTWTLSGNKLIIHNNGPHYVTLNSVAWLTDKKETPLVEAMVAPFANLEITAPEKTSASKNIRYKYIADSGALIERETQLDAQ